MTPFVETIGMDFAGAEEESKFPVLEARDYPFQTVGSEIKEAGPNSQNPGRPYVNWSLEVINQDDVKLNGLRLFYITPLPWAANKKCKRLCDFVKALGKPWEGNSGFQTEDYHGLTGIASVEQREYNGEITNGVTRISSS